LGCNNFGWTLDAAASQKVIDRALELGVTLFDTADYYGEVPGRSEEVLGRALGARRKDIVLATKFGVPLAGELRFDNSRRFILNAVEGSLRRLGTDWIDIYMLHWPDPLAPLEETLRALHDLVTSGKVRYIACSNLPTWRIVEAQWISRTSNLHHFIAAQNEYSLLNRTAEAELIPALQQYGVGLLPYYPLAGGLLTGKYLSTGAPAEGRLARNFLKLGDRFMTEANLRRVERLDAFARSREHTLLELALSWLAMRPAVASLIAGATRPEQLESNIRAADWKLSDQELSEVDRLCKEPV
jgi:aryl-alcohol dehydrogenase-like predicted oxidoreductase